MKRVYCAVRAGSLNKAVWASSLKGYIAIKTDSVQSDVTVGGRRDTKFPVFVIEIQIFKFRKSTLIPSFLAYI